MSTNFWAGGNSTAAVVFATGGTSDAGTGGDPSVGGQTSASDDSDSLAGAVDSSPHSSKFSAGASAKSLARGTSSVGNPPAWASTEVDLSKDLSVSRSLVASSVSSTDWAGSSSVVKHRLGLGAEIDFSSSQ